MPRPALPAAIAADSAPRTGRISPYSPKFADDFETVETLRGQLAGARENAERDAEIEAAAFLRQVGRREVDGDLAFGKREVARLNCAFDPLARLANRSLGQTRPSQNPAIRRTAASR